MGLWVSNVLASYDVWVEKQENKLKLFGPDIFRWGGDLLREGVGAKKLGVALENQGKQFFGWLLKYSPLFLFAGQGEDETPGMGEENVFEMKGRGRGRSTKGRGGGSLREGRRILS